MTAESMIRANLLHEQWSFHTLIIGNLQIVVERRYYILKITYTEFMRSFMSFTLSNALSDSVVEAELILAWTSSISLWTVAGKIT